jgi:hypothetical protein
VASIVPPSGVAQFHQRPLSDATPSLWASPGTRDIKFGSRSWSQSAVWLPIYSGATRLPGRFGEEIIHFRRTWGAITTTRIRLHFGRNKSSAERGDSALQPLAGRGRALGIKLSRRDPTGILFHDGERELGRAAGFAGWKRELRLMSTVPTQADRGRSTLSSPCHQTGITRKW